MVSPGLGLPVGERSYASRRSSTKRGMVRGAPEAVNKRAAPETPGRRERYVTERNVMEAA
jgi:hypothetical protein